MRRSALLIAALSAVVTLAMPFLGAGGPSLFSATSAHAGVSQHPATDFAGGAGEIAAARVDASPAREIVPAAGGTAERRTAVEAVGMTCPGPIEGATASVSSRVAGGGVITGTTSADLATFAAQFNAIRVANCLQPVPLANFRHDTCMEDRLVWMAEDPSDDPLSAWGHMGSVRSDGVPSVGCDGNLAGGSGDSGASVADKWWGSDSHRTSLYKPGYEGAIAGICIGFAATHGGIGTTVNEAPDFMRAAARWASC